MILVSVKITVTPDFRLDLISFLVLMNEQTIGAIMGNYNVALLAGHKVMHDSLDTLTV